MPDVRDVPICGGGRANDHLMCNIQGCLQDLTEEDIRVMPAEAWGFDGDAIEAAAFAWLAYRRMANLSGNDPTVTGALGARVLGAIYTG
jgi:anhydro-N-acetylmuramic acid kinase